MDSLTPDTLFSAIRQAQMLQVCPRLPSDSNLPNAYFVVDSMQKVGCFFQSASFQPDI